MSKKGFVLCCVFFCFLLIQECFCNYVVKKKKKNQTCGLNELWDPCPSKCYSDGIYDVESKLIRSKPCSLQPKKPCKGKCRCLDGFVRLSTNNTCVLKESCCLDPNEEWTPCVNKCPGGTCEMPEFMDPPCPESCMGEGCQCRAGYVRNSENKCIPLDNCVEKQDCAGNQVWVTYRGWCFMEFPCDLILSNIYPAPCPPPQFWEPLNGRCACPPNTYRFNNTRCVTLDECCSLRSPNSSFSYCKEPCPMTCQNLNATSCKSENCFGMNGCDCKSGYLLKDMDTSPIECVLPEDCPVGLP